MIGESYLRADSIVHQVNKLINQVIFGEIALHMIHSINAKQMLAVGSNL